MFYPLRRGIGADPCKTQSPGRTTRPAVRGSKDSTAGGESENRHADLTDYP